MSGIPYELTRKFVREFGIVLLEDAARVRVGVGHGDHRVGLCAFTVLRVSKGSRLS